MNFQLSIAAHFFSSFSIKHGLNNCPQSKDSPNFLAVLNVHTDNSQETFQCSPYRLFVRVVFTVSVNIAYSEQLRRAIRALIMFRIVSLCRTFQ